MKKDGGGELEKLKEDMDMAELLEAYNVVRAKRNMDPIRQWTGSRELLTERVERAERKRAKEARGGIRAPRKKARAKPGIGRPGVGKYVRELLAAEVGRTEDGQFPVGHSYQHIVDAVQEAFPGAKCDAKHVRWYCTKMREQGMTAPVYRERSHWK